MWLWDKNNGLRRSQCGPSMVSRVRALGSVNKKQELDLKQPAPASTENKLESPGRLPEAESDSDRIPQWLQKRSGREAQTLRHHLRNNQRLGYIGVSGEQSESRSVLNWARGL